MAAVDETGERRTKWRDSSLSQLRATDPSRASINQRRVCAAAARATLKTDAHARRRSQSHSRDRSLFHFCGHVTRKA